jgi:hypothetical protein
MCPALRHHCVNFSVGFELFFSKVARRFFRLVLIVSSANEKRGKQFKILLFSCCLATGIQCKQLSYPFRIFRHTTAVIVVHIFQAIWANLQK